MRPTWDSIKREMDSDLKQDRETRELKESIESLAKLPSKLFEVDE